MRLHFHHDPDWQARGCWFYFTCRRCGARRIRRRYANLDGFADPGWVHLLIDKHGRNLDDSGWVRPIAGRRPGPRNI